MAILSLDADLNCGDPLLDSDEVSRHCQPNDYDRRLCEPKVSAFQRRPSEIDASINRLQFFGLQDRSSAVEYIRQEFRAINYNLRPNGRFVVFNVGEAKAAALKVGGYDLVFQYTPKPPVCSHSSILNLPEDPCEERAVATALKRLITKTDTYHAVI